MKLVLCTLFLVGIWAKAAEPITVYFFSNATCPISQAHQKPWDELRQKFQSETRRFVIIETPLYLQDKGKISEESIGLIRRFEVRSVPTFVVVGADGRTKYFGLFSENPLNLKLGRHFLREAILSLTNGAPVKQSITRPTGCAVPEWVFKGK